MYIKLMVNFNELFSKFLFYKQQPLYLIDVLYYNIEKWLFKSKLIKPNINKLVILDDIFPHPFSAFRFMEFNHYLNFIDNIHIYTSGDAFKSIHENKTLKEVIDEYVKENPQHKNKISIFNHHKLIHTELAYILFAGNVISHLKMLERNRIPFIFTLYPGFGFRIDDPKSISDLQQIFSSPMFRKVIVTQKVVHDYLLKSKLCSVNDIYFIYGLVLQFSKYLASIVPKSYYKTDKDTFDICFVANKQMLKGIDKGYDLFVAAAHVLAKMYDNIHFHIVGPYKEEDINVRKLEGRISFYGKFLTNEFPPFYARMDIIPSPNRSNVLAKGAFDGFPTGSCTEAGLNGVALMVTDDLNQNIKFVDGYDIVIIDTSVADIVDKVRYYYVNFEELYQIASNGQKKIIDIYNEEAQLNPRLNLLLEYIGTNKLTSAT